MNERVLQLGVIGLGRAFTLMLPTFVADQRVRLVAAAEPRAAARELFQREFGRAHESVNALCADPAVEAIYIASPHQMHAAHVRLAAQAGKHVLVEKPMAITLSECQAMIAAATAAASRRSPPEPVHGIRRGRPRVPIARCCSSKMAPSPQRPTAATAISIRTS